MTLAIFLPLVVSISASNVELYFGQSSTFSTSVSGGAGPYSYTWYLNDSEVIGAISSIWTFTPRANGNYTVYAKVSDSLNNEAQSNIVSDLQVYSVYLTLNVEPYQATYDKSQLLTFSVVILNQLSPELDSTLIIAITGPNGYYFCDPHPILVAANSVETCSIDWIAPETSGTYNVEVNLTPSILTAYDVMWLKIM